MRPFVSVKLASSLFGSISTSRVGAIPASFAPVDEHSSGALALSPSSSSHPHCLRTSRQRPLIPSLQPLQHQVATPRTSAPRPVPQTACSQVSMVDQAPMVNSKTSCSTSVQAVARSSEVLPTGHGTHSCVGFRSLSYSPALQLKHPPRSKQTCPTSHS